MPDYGLDVEFGTFLTPTAGQPQQPVLLAQLTERAALDLVTVQDHPYQPAFLDTWTLLSVIAGETERVRLMPNVANLPLRPPAVLARSAASLDLLSGGRVELGLGAGAFWDAIVANGGPRRTPGEAVEALDEAIAIIRAIWAADRSVRVDGAHYRVVGAKAGPAPAHAIGIHIGAYKPRMLRLIGRRADGWLPTLGYLKADELPALNKVIDDAATGAGRSPSDIRRMLNISGEFGSGSGFLTGSPVDWAQQLAELTMTAGISTYILAGDDPAMIERFGLEVAPAVRELVDDYRGGTAAALAAPEPVMETIAPARVPAGEFDVMPTPDDGVRRSSVRLWDEAARPSGPTRPDGRRYTAHERAAGRHLIDVHDHLRHELAQIFDLVDQVEAGVLSIGAARSALNEMTLRQNNWTLGTYCQQYCRVVTTHHTIEDVSVFPHLRTADPGLAPVIDRLEEEHRVIHDVIERVDEALVALVATDGSTTSLREAVDLLADTLLSHLSYEERELVEPLARLGFQGSL